MTIFQPPLALWESMPISSTSLKPRGVLAGLQAGYNWQIDKVLVGIEFDGNWMDGTASRTLTNFGPPLNRGDVLTTDVNSEFLTTIRPRLGVVFDRFLVYVTGGLAFATIKTTNSLQAEERCSPRARLRRAQARR